MRAGAGPRGASTSAKAPLAELDLHQQVPDRTFIAPDDEGSIDLGRLLRTFPKPSGSVLRRVLKSDLDRVGGREAPRGQERPQDQSCESPVECQGSERIDPEALARGQGTPPHMLLTRMSDHHDRSQRFRSRNSRLSTQGRSARSGRRRCPAIGPSYLAVLEMVVEIHALSRTPEIRKRHSEGLGVADESTACDGRGGPLGSGCGQRWLQA